MTAERYLIDGRLDGYSTEVLDRGHGGQRVLKVLLDRGPVIVKVYGPRGRWLRVAVRDVGRALIGKSPMNTAARYLTEGELLRLWRQYRLPAPRPLMHDFPSLAGRMYHVMQFCEGPLAWNLLVDKSRTTAARARLLRRFTRQWARRHRLALDSTEPRLVQMRAGFSHLIVRGKRFVAFDFEGGFGRHHEVAPLISLEIMAYLRSLASACPEDFDRLIRVIVRHYPDRAQLERVNEDVLRGVYPPLRHLARLQMTFRRGDRGAKQMVRKALKQALRDPQLL